MTGKLSRKNLLVVFAIIGVVILIFGFSLAPKVFNTPINQSEPQIELLSSATSVASPILIDDNGGEGMTWQEAKTELGFNGFGTEAEPYILENLIIDGGGTEYCICIENSDANFIIRNCTLFNSGTEYTNSGVFLFCVNNGLIYNNTCYNNQMGIVCWHECHNINISKNIVKDNEVVGIMFGIDTCSENNVFENIATGNYLGIEIAGHHNNIFDNYVVENIEKGIAVHDHDNVVTKNRVEHNYEGIFVVSDQFNLISENEIHYNSYGLTLHLGEHAVILRNNISHSSTDGMHLFISSNNTFSENYLVNNQRGFNLYDSDYNNITKNHCTLGDYGILLDNFSDNNTITQNLLENNHDGVILGAPNSYNVFTRNEIIDNDNYGVEVRYDANLENQFYQNIFTGNTVNAYDAGTNTKWDDGAIGNCWDDYSGVDANDDGIGDTPYAVPGPANAVDNYPIFEDGDDAPYSITINCTNVSNVIKIFGMDYIPRGESQTFELDEGFYSLFGGQVGIFAAFEVNSSGVVNYDVELDGSVLLGLGTSTITIVGHSITVDATDVDQRIALGYWSIAGTFLGWTEPGCSSTYNLVISGGYKYSLYTYFTHAFAYFDVLPTGVISYDESQIGFIEGNNTDTVRAVGHPITIDATDVDQDIAFEYWALTGSFMGWTKAGNTTTYRLVANGQYDYSLYTYFTHLFTYFRVLPTGAIYYDTTQLGVIEGNETNVVRVIGHPITIDATDVDQDIAFEYWALTGSFMGWTKAGNTTTYRLVANGQYDYSLYTYFTHLFTYFRVLPTGAIYYDTTQLGVIEGNETNVVRVIGHPITIDATDVDQDIAFEYWALTGSFMGWTKAGNTTTYRLVANGQYDYSLYTYFTHLFAYFRVLPTGVIYYDNTQLGIIEGNGTTTIKPIGYPITIDATEVDQHIGLGYWALLDSFMGWTDPGTTRTYRLVANPNVSGGLAYRLYVANAHWFADFAVKPTGSLWYTEAFEGVVKGNNTSMITPIGHPITVDNTHTTSRAGVSHPGNPDLFLGYTEPGETRTYYLVANTQYPFPVYLENSGVGQFRVYSNKTCSPNEFPTAAGTIFIYYNYDDVPPITEVLISGIEGNDGWYLSDVEITLTSEDLETGVYRTEYSLDGINWINYTGQFMITSEGLNEICYRSIDNAGNVEDSKYIQINIDKSLPHSQIEMNIYYDDSSGTIYVTSSTVFSFSTNDEISGIAKVHYRINGGDWCVYEAPFSLDDSVECYIIEYYSEDLAGNEEEFNSISVCVAGLEFISYVSRGEDNPVGYFDVIFTFCKQTDEYKLVATNPGQLFYILEVVNTWPTSIESLDVEICLPADFCFKEGDTIQVFADGIDITSECLINGDLISVLELLPGMNLKIVVHLEYVLKGTYYPSLDAFGMKGYKFNSEISANHGDPMIPDSYLEESLVDSATLTTHQKKTTAIAGYVYNTNGMGLEGLTVELWMNGELITSTVTDENGFYYFIDIAEGEYEVRVYFGDSNEIQVAMASKNELTEVNFELEYYPP